MQAQLRNFLVLVLLMFACAQVFADSTSDAIKVFRGAGQSGPFFSNSYGYAVFPTIGKGGIGIGGAHGKGKVYAGGKHVGDTAMTQVTIGLQLGGQAYSEVIFFENKAAFDAFTSGNFEFGAQASAVAITAGASAQTGTTGTTTGASATQKDAATAAKYSNGMAVFTVAKGGLMYEASIGGQKFSYTPKKK
ncbi:MAG TPA: YSC84-related protein [Burkholderiales bacterium]|nr:YSC84-related protein [Burkholderiales bacterium]